MHIGRINRPIFQMVSHIEQMATGHRLMTIMGKKESADFMKYLTVAIRYGSYYAFNTGAGVPLFEGGANPTWLVYKS